MPNVNLGDLSGGKAMLAKPLANHVPNRVGYTLYRAAGAVVGTT